MFEHYVEVNRSGKAITVPRRSDYVNEVVAARTAHDLEVALIVLGYKYARRDPPTATTFTTTRRLGEKTINTIIDEIRRDSEHRSNEHLIDYDSKLDQIIFKYPGC